MKTDDLESLLLLLAYNLESVLLKKGVKKEVNLVLQCILKSFEFKSSIR
ncbi:hypothetical protein JYT59_00940 [Sphingobacteriaceae bacterium AH-315-L07]|nr:hypothetical protein [Sphingobacteriaceae bacterium AH-315-L07]